MKKLIISWMFFLGIACMTTSLMASDIAKEDLNKDYKSKSVSELFSSLYESTGLNA